MSKGQKISGQFVPHLVEMIASPAWRALSLSGHRLLAVLETELGKRGGTGNGRLISPYADFAEYGIDRHAIAPAIRETVALGFLEVVEAGQAGVGDHRRATRYRLTYTDDAKGRTHEWRRIKTIDEARAIAKAARADKDGKEPA